MLLVFSLYSSERFDCLVLAAFGVFVAGVLVGSGGSGLVGFLVLGWGLVVFFGGFLVFVLWAGSGWGLAGLLVLARLLDSVKKFLFYCIMSKSNNL